MSRGNVVITALMSFSAILGGGLAGCTRNTVAVKQPQAPVAVPTANTTQPAAPIQGRRNEGEPDVPFDGGRPEEIVLATPAAEEASERSVKPQSIYAELLGQSLVCEEVRP